MTLPIRVRPRFTRRDAFDFLRCNREPDASPPPLEVFKRTEYADGVALGVGLGRAEVTLGELGCDPREVVFHNLGGSKSSAMRGSRECVDIGLSARIVGMSGSAKSEVSMRGRRGAAGRTLLTRISNCPSTAMQTLPWCGT